MVQNLALAAIVALFSTATLAGPSSGDTTGGQNNNPSEVKAGAEGSEASNPSNDEKKPAEVEEQKK